MQRLKKVDCCWYCKKNEECGNATFNNEPVCLLDQPCVEECFECDIYNNCLKDPVCTGFIEK